MAIDQPRIGVVGVGHLGQHHVKHLAKMKRVRFSGIYDKDRSRAEKIASDYKIKSFNSLNELIDGSDGLTVVTPTADHCATALKCIHKGKHVFIEKPISDSVKSANSLLRAAEESGVLIQVGHIERLNPALLAIKDYELSPKFIEIQRLAPYTSRGTDVPVVLDLMIHDIDILLYFVDSTVKNISATGLSIMTDSVDIAHARIQFKNGTVASLTSSRIAKDKVRKIKVFQKNMYITIDMLLTLSEVYRVVDKNKSHSKFTAQLDYKGTHREIVYEKPEIQLKDPLQMELENFSDSIKGNSSPIVSGKSGRDVLAVAEHINNLILEDLH
ncbi:uncharacterized protein METZ01_LOCUS148656 [marine metagenome]|uniref:Uncharacterized protein n=1 Tax=marine metagenome TaxID=408172 RepID=A0A382A3S6_9ZZZZ|tara:strand:- start:2397 stop:3380 length:984 start_codon:yes stop_codon:yes gene_type:complete